MIYSDETRGTYEFSFSRLRDLEARHENQLSDFDNDYLSADDLEELEWLRGCLDAAKANAQRREKDQQEEMVFAARAATTEANDPDGDIAQALRRERNFRNRGIGRLIREETVEVRKPGGSIGKARPTKAPTRFYPSSQRGGLDRLKHGLG